MKKKKKELQGQSIKWAFYVDIDNDDKWSFYIYSFLLGKHSRKDTWRYNFVRSVQVLLMDNVSLFLE